MKLPVYIYATYDEYEKAYNFDVWSCDMSSSEHVGPLVGQTEIDFTPPPRDVLVNGTIEQYRAAQKKIMAKAELNIKVLEQRINDLLCLEYKPETA